MAATAPPRLLVTRRLPDAVIARARDGFEVHGNLADDRWHPQDLAERVRRTRAELILCAPTDRFDAAFIAGLPPKVAMIATYSAGIDHIDLEAARARGIVVANTPDVLTAATADVAMLCLLGAARRAREAQDDLRNGRWDRWSPTGYLGLELEGAVLGIVGMGRIGRATARRAKGFGMQIAYWNRSAVAPDVLAEDGVSAENVPDLDRLVATCDAISLHVPETPQTRHIIDARRLGLMRRRAVLVNTARGALLDDAAVVDALESGRLAGVGLDVFTGEPDVHPGYLTARNAFLLPHIGSATVRTREAMGSRALENLEAFVAGFPPPDRVV